MQLILRDRDPELIESWRRHFEGDARVGVSQGDIFGAEADAIISPANSFGFMDGGIDLAYTRRFGWDLQRRLRRVLAEEHGGELPVGQAVVVRIGDGGLRWLVSAPTMRVPEDVSKTANAYLAFRAALRAIEAHNREHPDQIESLLCPGLGTGIGRMPPERCALQMQAAWLGVSQPMEYASLGMAKEIHFRLTSS